MASPLKYTKDSLLERFQEINNTRYNYELPDIIKVNEYINITCILHNRTFRQKICNHLRGQGCRKCAARQTKPIDLLLFEFNQIHESKYFYNVSTFIGVSNIMEIVCSEHGIFYQRPNDHRRGQGCPKCVGDSLETIITKLIQVHKEKYDYSKIKLSNSKCGKVIHDIICPPHGTFSTLKTNHIAGHGCPKCGILSMIKATSLDIHTRIKQAQAVHGNLYEYDYTSDAGNKFKTSIKCKAHGVFKQRWGNHITSAHGCPKCNAMTGRFSKEYFARNPTHKTDKTSLYLIKLHEDNIIFYKIGISKNTKIRFKQIPYEHELLYLEEGLLYDMFLKEQLFLNTYGYKNRYSPKIRFGGDKECFILPEKEILELLT